jgi:hypothetical protein
LKVSCIAKDVWTIWAVCSERGEDVIEQLLANWHLDGQMHAFIERISENGGLPLPHNRNHAIDEQSQPTIMQFTVGQFRLAYIYDGEKVIVLCAAYPKGGGKTGKVSKTHKRVAKINLRNYLDAKHNGTLEFLEEDE